MLVLATGMHMLTMLESAIVTMHMLTMLESAMLPIMGMHMLTMLESAMLPIKSVSQSVSQCQSVSLQCCPLNHVVIHCCTCTFLVRLEQQCCL